MEDEAPEIEDPWQEENTLAIQRVGPTWLYLG